MHDDQLFTSFITEIGSVKKLKPGKHAQPNKPGQNPKAQKKSPKTNQASINIAEELTNSYTLPLPLLSLNLNNWIPIAPQEAISWCHPSAKEWLAKLTSGKLSPLKILDLHGYILADAARELEHELTRWYNQKVRIARIIHGKGNSERPSIIKSHMPLWLNNHPLVIAYASDLPPNGGTGSLLLVLRKQK